MLIILEKKNAKGCYKEVLVKVKEIHPPKTLNVKKDALEFTFDKQLSEEQVNKIKELGDKQSFWQRLFT